MGPVVLVADAVLQEGHRESAGRGTPRPEARRDRRAARAAAGVERRRLHQAPRRSHALRRQPRYRRRPLRTHTRGAEDAGRDRRNAAGAGERSAVPVPHELPDPTSPLRRRQHRRGGRRARARSLRFLECHARADAGQPDRHGGPRHHEAWRKARHDFVERSVVEEQLPGLRRLRRGGPGDFRRRGSEPARAHRGVQAADHE